MSLKQKKRRRRDQQLRRTQRKQRKDGRSKALPGKPAGEGDIFFSDHPLSGVPREVVQEAMLKFSHEAAQKLPALGNEILRAARALSPTYFLASMAMSAMFVGMNNSGDIVPLNSNHAKKLQQSHLEFAQAIFLSLPIEEFQETSYDPGSIQDFSNKLYDMFDAFQHSRYGAIKNASTEELRSLLMIQERVRLHTQGVRNWGYFRQVLDVLRKLFTPLDAHCVRATGIRASDYITLFEKMLAQIEQGMNEYRRKLSSVFLKTKNEQFIAEYVRQFSLNEKNISDMLQLVREQNWDKDHLRAFAISHSTLHLLSSFEFSTPQIASWIGAAESDTAKAIQLVSLRGGELSQFQFEHFFLGNPVWEKPIIRVESTQYFCCLPHLFFAFAFHIFDGLFSFDVDAHRAHGRRRSQFLQSEVEAYFSTAFGEQIVLPECRWTLNGVGYETDLLIRVDSHLFIIELKSNKVSWPALRGAPKPLKRQIQELMVDPAEQSARLEAAIRRKISGKETDFQISPEILQGVVSEITRLSITLEDFATIQSDLKAIKACGFHLNGSLPVTMSLADLQTIFTILDNPVERIFYLHRRQQIQETVLYQGDELDMLGIYLATGFDLGEAEKGLTRLVAVGMSEKVDRYFQARDEGFAPALPRRRMGKWFTDVVSRLTVRKSARWTEMALLLLSLNFEQQAEFEKHYNRMRAKLLNRPRGAPDMENIVMLVPPEWRAAGFACVAFFEDEDRHQIMEDAASHVFERSAATRCLVLARDIRDISYPYATLALFGRPLDIR